MTGTSNWNASSSDWSSGFPTSSSVVCIDLAGTYTVELTSGTTINTLELGGATSGAQTVLIDGAGGSDLSLGAPSYVENGGTLTLESGTSGNSQISGGSGSVTVASGGSLTTGGTADTVFIQVPVTNQSGGTVTIGSTTTDQNATTLTTNSGTFTVSGGANLALSGNSTFTQSAGTLTLTGALEPTVDDRQLITQIGNLADEERRLEEMHVGEGLSPDEEKRLKSLALTLDQMWDLLRQRRALRNAGRSPDDAVIRPEGTVEGYRQ